MQSNEKIDLSNFKIGVVGAGSWGTALANLLADKGFAIDLWVFEREVIKQIVESGENQYFLPDVKLSPNLKPLQDLGQVISGKDLVLVVVPSHVMRETTLKMTGYISKEAIVVTASKGIENKTHLTMTGVLSETLPEIPTAHQAVISGPSFAREVARNLPTVVTVASKDMEVAALVQQVMVTPHFRVYTSDDVVGVELGGSLKNVIAIAAGIVDGLQLGLNTRAALITRGMTEIRRLGLKMGANPRTFTGLAGFFQGTCNGGTGGSIRTELSRGEVTATILEGFFPRVDARQELVEDALQPAHAHLQRVVPAAHAGGREEVPEVAQRRELLLDAQVRARRLLRHRRIDDERQVGEDLALFLLLVGDEVGERDRLGDEVEVREPPAVESQRAVGPAAGGARPAAPPPSGIAVLAPATAAILRWSLRLRSLTCSNNCSCQACPLKDLTRRWPWMTSSVNWVSSPIESCIRRLILRKRRLTYRINTKNTGPTTRNNRVSQPLIQNM